MKKKKIWKKNVKIKNKGTYDLLDNGGRECSGAHQINPKAERESSLLSFNFQS